MTIHVPAETPANVFFAQVSSCANLYPPITIATRLATFAIVPVKRLWMAVKPVSNGEPCASATAGMTRRSVTTTAGERAHLDARTGGDLGGKWTQDQPAHCSSPPHSQS